MTGITRQLGHFIATLDPATIPQDCRRAARIGMTDCIAGMAAGAGEPAPRIVSEMAAPASGADSAPEIPGGRMLRVADAALVNGVAGHVLDYDDVAMDGHPSAALTPAILAEGWAIGVSGADAIAAYVIGFETWAALLSREPSPMHEAGFHPTGLWGTMAAAAACARLNNLNAEQSTQALAIAASCAAGLTGNFGTMTKSLHAGRAAQAGVTAARLAKRGFTGAPDIVEQSRGFLRVHSLSGKPDLSDTDLQLGQTWRLAHFGLDIKRYPVCYFAHRSIDAALDLVIANNLKPADIAEIRVTIGETQLGMLRNHTPQDALAAKFSIEFAMASALIARSVGFPELTDTFVQRTDVADAMRKVTTSTTKDLIPGTPFAPSDEVAMVLRSGDILTHPPVEFAKGAWKNPLSAEELREKFMGCVQPSFGANRAASLFEAMQGLEKNRLRDLPIAQAQ